MASLPATPESGAFRVLMIGDWGTHMEDNVALLRQAIKKFTPDAIIQGVMENVPAPDKPLEVHGAAAS